MQKKNKTGHKTTRRKARRLALQAVYQWQLSAASSQEIENQFMEEVNSKKVDVPYFLELLRNITKLAEELDQQMLPILDRRIDELNPVELAVLRIAIYELIYRLDVPYKVIINEALELSKLYGAVEGFKYVNGVLDKVAKKLRAVEIAGHNRVNENN